MQKKFQAGNLDRRITILQPTKTKDRSGQELITYTTFHNCSAGLIETKGTEKNEDMGIHEINKKTFLIRHKAGVNVEMLIEYEGQKYNIKSVYEPQGTRRQWWLIDATYKD